VLSLGSIEDVELEQLAPKVPSPPKFNKPVNYVRTSTAMLRDFGILTRPGGLNQQSAALVRDMITWLNGQNYWLYQYRKRLTEEARAKANGSG
jgi:hypothetical protein